VRCGLRKQYRNRCTTKDAHREKGDQAEERKKIMGRIKAEGTTPISHRRLEHRFLGEERQDITAEAKQNKKNKKQKDKRNHFPPIPDLYVWVGRRHDDNAVCAIPDLLTEKKEK
jgi:hypothetical protein